MIEITDLNELRKIVLNKEFNSQVIILDFFASWCTSCTILTPELEKLEMVYGNRVLVIKIDVDKARDIAKAFNIEAVPSGLFFFKNRLFSELTLVGSTIGAYFQNVNVLLSQYNV